MINCTLKYVCHPKEVTLGAQVHHYNSVSIYINILQSNLLRALIILFAITLLLYMICTFLFVHIIIQTSARVRSYLYHILTIVIQYDN